VEKPEAASVAFATRFGYTSHMASGTGERRLGEVIGKYTLVSVLGEGGMATVYEAVHRNGNQVALKLLHPQLAVHGDARARFIEEAYTANKIAHPGVVRVLDDDESAQGEAYMVMELLVGETLDAWQRRVGPRLPAEEVFAAIHEVLDVLVAAHEAGIVHRDLKPENLFRTADGRIMVLDFGIARTADSSRPGRTGVGSLLGTPGYMPPEQAQGRVERVDARSDLWAVGATAFSLLAGRCVHEAETPAMMRISSAMEPAPPVSSCVTGLSAELAAVVDTALCFAREERWQSALEMHRALGEAFTQTYGRSLARASTRPSARLSAPPAGASARPRPPQASTLHAIGPTQAAPSTGPARASSPAEAPRAILVVDDDAPVGEILGAQLRQAGHDCQVVTSGAQALEALEQRPFAMVLSDLHMPRMDGRALLSEIGARWPHVPVALISAYGTISIAVEAMKAGAVDFVQKPFDRAELLYVVAKVLETRPPISTWPKAAARPGAHGLDSEGLRELRALVARVAHGSGAVLVRGESGTEKALVARAIHDESARAAKPFVTVRCAAFSGELLERELFGYEKGAFVGAAQAKPGRAELADGGTLFLDEIGELPLSLQVRLVHLLAEREIERVGATRPVPVDTRIVATTHADLGALVAAGAFREDLHCRLNVVPIEIPPLRARPADIDAIASHLAMAQAESGRRVCFSPDALACLRAQTWPNNVPELHAFVERLLILHEGATLEAGDVQRALAR